ncbi:MAG: hypothetical protein HYV63_10975 [Candidatus Schekmanbacteria bacterium]|nr:hypothetical protein [Candidatus Schekmanbacteria bacterium]
MSTRNEGKSAASPPPNRGAVWGEHPRRDPVERLQLTLALVLVALFAGLTTADGAAIGGADRVAPQPPAELTASAVANGVALAWTSSDGAARYHLYRRVDESSSVAERIASLSAAELAYTDLEAYAGVRYAYSVSAESAAGEEGERSPEATVTAGAVTFNVSVLPVGEAAARPGAALFFLIVKSENGFTDTVQIEAIDWPVGVQPFFAPSLVPVTAASPWGLAGLWVSVSEEATVQGWVALKVRATGRTSAQVVEASVNLYVLGTGETRVFLWTFPARVPLGGHAHLLGRVIPGAGGGVVTIDAVRPDGSAYPSKTATTGPFGWFLTDIQPDQVGGPWRVTATVNDASSAPASFSVGQRRTLMGLYTDIQPGETAGQVAGWIFPNPHWYAYEATIPDVILHYLPPNTKEGEAGEVVRSVPLNPDGTFVDNFDVYAGEVGKWKLVAEWSGNDVYMGVKRAVQVPLLVSVGKAIVLGALPSGTNLDSVAGNTMKRMTDLAYRVLLMRGFTAADIAFLSPDLADPRVAGAPTLQNLSAAVAAFAGATTNQSPLVLYAHGRAPAGAATAGLDLGNGDVLTSAAVNSVLGTESTVLLLDIDQSGRYIAEDLERWNILTGEWRALVTATNDTSPAHSMADGRISAFSFFWTWTQYGASLYEAGYLTEAALNTLLTPEFAAQDPQLGIFRNRQGNDAFDLILAANVWIGYPAQLPTAPPIVLDTTPDATAERLGGSRESLRAGLVPFWVNTAEHLPPVAGAPSPARASNLRVWAVPYAPVAARLPEATRGPYLGEEVVELADQDGDQRYTGSVPVATDGATVVISFAENELGLVSDPGRTVIVGQEVPAVPSPGAELLLLLALAAAWRRLPPRMQAR